MPLCVAMPVMYNNNMENVPIDLESVGTGIKVQGDASVDDTPGPTCV